MKILLEPPKVDSPTFEVDHQIAVALGVLHDAVVMIRGAGRFGSGAATIQLVRDGDTVKALAALQKVGIQAHEAPELLLTGPNLERAKALWKN